MEASSTSLRRYGQSKKHLKRKWLTACIGTPSCLPYSGYQGDHGYKYFHPGGERALQAPGAISLPVHRFELLRVGFSHLEGHDAPFEETIYLQTGWKTEADLDHRWFYLLPCLGGLREFVQDYKEAKKRVLSIRWRYHNKHLPGAQRA